MDKKYCFQCNKENEYYIKQEYNEYEIHGVIYKVKQNIYYCAVCNEEIDGGNLQEHMEQMCLGYLEHFGLSYEKLINIRKKYNLTQAEFAKVMGWSNKSVVRYEKGQSLPQREYVDAYLELEVNPYILYNMVETKKKELGESYKDIINKLKSTKQFKGISLLLFYLNKKKLFKTQATKLSFFTDFKCLKNINNKISSFEYAHAPYGPLINDFDERINDLIAAGIIEITVDDEDRLLLSTNMKCHTEIFIDEELQIMEDIYNKYGDKSSSELSDISHKFIGWQKTKNGEIIDESYANDINI